jgi:hypothetical protein
MDLKLPAFMGITLVGTPNMLQCIIWGFLLVSVVVGLFYVIKWTFSDIFGIVKSDSDS